MTWYSIRLDLSRSPEFPEGSADHCYLIQAPLDAAGMIDAAAVRVAPDRAKVLRSWPDEAERTGHLAHRRRQWLFSYMPGEDDDETVFHLETHALRIGDYITVTERDGEQLCFRVVRCDALADA